LGNKDFCYQVYKKKNDCDRIKSGTGIEIEGELMKLRLQLFAGYVFVFATMLILAGVTYYSQSLQSDTSNWVVHTYDVIKNARQIEKLVLDRETGLRGFIITGDDVFLEPYNSSIKHFTPAMIDLKREVSDNPSQVQILESISTLVDNLTETVAKPEISARREVGISVIDAENLQELLSNGIGKGIMDEIRQLIERIAKAFRKAGNLNGEIYALAAAKAMVDQETGERGFLVTGEESFLEPFEKGKADFLSSIASLRNLNMGSSENGLLKKDIDSLVALGNDWLKRAANPEIAVRREMNKTTFSLKKIAAMVASGNGKRFVDSIRQQFARFVEVEERLLELRTKAAERSRSISSSIVIWGTLFGIGFGIVAMFLLSNSILRQVGGEPAEIAAITQRVASGDLDIESQEEESEGTGIYGAVRIMVAKLRQNREETERQDWLRTGLARLSEKMLGNYSPDKLTGLVLKEMANYMGASVGSIYLVEIGGDKSRLKRFADYAYVNREDLPDSIELGQGLVGQVASGMKQILVKDVPKDYIRITSGLGDAVPTCLCISPLVYEGKLLGVLELGSINEFTDLSLQYLQQALPAVAISLETVQGRVKLDIALEKANELSESLTVQQEELRASNEELEEQTQALLDSEARLRMQQEELQASNEELEEQTQSLMETEQLLLKQQR
jgi:CHASE3 domain sensor protein